MHETLPALLPGIRQTAMPTFEKFSAAGVLRVRRHWETDAVLWDAHVRDDQLMPRDACNSILTELAAANSPAPKPVAARIVKLLLGAWPSRELTDPAIFASVLGLTLGSYPADVGLQAVDELTRKSKWLPTRCELIEALDEAMLPRKYAAHVVRKHLERHDEIDKARAAEAKRMEERRQRYIREPWLMIRDEFRQSFPGIDGEIWERWIEAACAEFDVRIVREWHEQARNAAAKPDNWHFLRLFLNKCADKARQDQQPAAPEGKQP